MITSYSFSVRRPTDTHVHIYIYLYKLRVVQWNKNRSPFFHELQGVHTQICDVTCAQEFSTITWSAKNK